MSGKHDGEQWAQHNINYNLTSRPVELIEAHYAHHPRLFAAGLLYHVILRGNQRRNTFVSDDGSTFRKAVERDAVRVG